MSYQNLDGKVRVRAGLSTTYSVLAIAIASATSMSAVAAPAEKKRNHRDGNGGCHWQRDWQL